MTLRKLSFEQIFQLPFNIFMNLLLPVIHIFWEPEKSLDLLAFEIVGIKRPVCWLPSNWAPKRLYRRTRIPDSRNFHEI